MHTTTLYGGIEAGGTKIVCSVGSGLGDLVGVRELSTTENPTESALAIVDFFHAYPDIKAIGLGCFGPLDIHPDSPTYGGLLSTPKKGWQGFNLLQYLKEHLRKPVHLATDTDVAAIGEYHFGKAKNCESLLYLTIGTGVGGTILQSGLPLHGQGNSEMGHTQIPSIASERTKGACKYHNYCLEGYASGEAIRIRTGHRGEQIEDSAFWRSQATYIAIGLLNILAIWQPEKIILGGGVLHRNGLVAMVHTAMIDANKNYLHLPTDSNYLQITSSDGIGTLGAQKLAALSHSQATKYKIPLELMEV